MIGQFTRYCFAGLVATVTHIAIMVSLIELLAIRPWVASGMAFSCAVFISYRVNHLWTFATVGTSLAQFQRFLLVAVAGASSHAGITYLMVDVLGYRYGFAIAVAILLITPMTFAANKWWTFRAASMSALP